MMLDRADMDRHASAFDVSVDLSHRKPDSRRSGNSPTELEHSENIEAVQRLRNILQSEI